MNKRHLGKLEVSPIGMGCMGFSHGYGQVPDEQYSIGAIRKAYEYGCNFFDTAEAYGDVMFSEGHNELIVGKAVKDFRNDVVIATKYHLHPTDFIEKRTLYEIVRHHMVQSMKRLQTNHIDLYYLHRVNENIPVEEVAEVMGRLIKDGDISEWGLSQVSVETLSKAHAVTPVAAVQNLYSMLERGCEKEMFPYTLKNNIGIVPFSPIASGFLSGKITSKTVFEEKDDVRKFVPQLSKENIRNNQPIIEVLQRFATVKNATNAQISLAWMLHKYPNVIPIPGSKNQERIIENLGAWNVSLSDSEFEALEQALDSCTVFGHRGFVETEQTNFGSNWEK